MKKLFKNYDFEFDRNEKKLLTTFCKQSLKQIENDSRFFGEVKAFNSIIEKVNGTEESIRFTKDEKNKLELLLKQNTKFLKEKAQKSWFLKKWMYKSLYIQYDSLIEKHFKE
jgi:hypothetical protein